MNTFWVTFFPEGKSKQQSWSSQISMFMEHNNFAKLFVLWNYFVFWGWEGAFFSGFYGFHWQPNCWSSIPWSGRERVHCSLYFDCSPTLLEAIAPAKCNASKKLEINLDTQANKRKRNYGFGKQGLKCLRSLARSFRLCSPVKAIWNLIKLRNSNSGCYWCNSDCGILDRLKMLDLDRLANLDVGELSEEDANGLCNQLFDVSRQAFETFSLDSLTNLTLFSVRTRSEEDQPFPVASTLSSCTHIASVEARSIRRSRGRVAQVWA